VDPRHGKFRGWIFVVSGPSGSGKTTLSATLLQDRQLRKRIFRSVSFTTRARRSQERNGRDYLFISEQEFRRKLRQKKILEWTRYLSYYYATPKGFVETSLRKGRNILLCLDLKGASRVKRLYPRNTVTIFIKPPSLEALESRIKKRCNKTKKEEIRQRLKLARQELGAWRLYDYSITNGSLPQAARALKKIILKKITG